MSSEPELLPCPFCGGAGHLSEAGGWASVGCNSAQTCPAYLRAQVHRTKDAAVTAWNRRAEREADRAAEREALEAMEKIKPWAWTSVNACQEWDDDCRKLDAAIEKLKARVG